MQALGHWQGFLLPLGLISDWSEGRHERKASTETLEQTPQFESHTIIASETRLSFDELFNSRQMSLRNSIDPMCDIVEPRTQYSGNSTISTAQTTTGG